METKVPLCVSRCVQCPFLGITKGIGKQVCWCTLHGRLGNEEVIDTIIADIRIKPEGCPLSQEGDSVTIIYTYCEEEKNQE